MGIKKPPAPRYEMGHVFGPDVAASIDRALTRIGETLLGVQGLDVLLSADLGFLDSGVEREPDPGAKRPRRVSRAARSLSQVVDRMELLLEDVEACAARCEFGAFLEVEDEFQEFCDGVRADLRRLRDSTADSELLDAHAQACGFLDEIQRVVFTDSRED